MFKADTLVQMRKPHATSSGRTSGGWGRCCYAPNGGGGFIIGHDGNNEPAINTAVRLNPRPETASSSSRPANRLLATRLAGEWVFWETGNLDFLTVTMEARRMFTVIAAGWIVILVGALVVAWRGRRARGWPFHTVAGVD